MNGLRSRRNKMKERNARTALSVFLAFLKIGAFTFGGGYAMIPLIRREAVEKHGWISDEELLEMVAIAESTPGPIAVNSATFVGQRSAGFLGAVLATFGVVLPSFAVISLITLALNEFSGIKAVQYAFFGVRAGVLALILKALWDMFRQSNRNLFSYIVMGCAFLAVAVFRINVLLVIVACAVAGTVSALLAEKRRGE